MRISLYIPLLPTLLAIRGVHRPGAPRPGRIAISDAMLRLLDSSGLRIVLAHERAHLRHRHHRYLARAEVAYALTRIAAALLG